MVFDEVENKRVMEALLECWKTVKELLLMVIVADPIQICRKLNQPFSLRHEVIKPKNLAC